MLIYAKNLAGDLTVLDLPADTTSAMLRHRLAAEVCPEDPSRLIILSRTRKAEESMSEEALTELLDEICEMTKSFGEEDQEKEQEEQEDQEKEQEEQETDWQNGDLLEYIVRDSEPLSVHLFEHEPLYTIDDQSQHVPYFWMRLEVRRRAEVVYEYGFLFRLQDGTFFSNWKFDMDDREVYVEIQHGHNGYKTIWEMLDSEKEQESEREPYIKAIRRAVGRKWIRVLRRRGQYRLAERRVRAVHPSECIPGEKQMWRDHYWAMRFGQRSAQRL